MKRILFTLTAVFTFSFFNPCQAQFGIGVGTVYSFKSKDVGLKAQARYKIMDFLTGKVALTHFLDGIDNYSVNFIDIGLIAEYHVTDNLSVYGEPALIFSLVSFKVGDERINNSAEALSLGAGVCHDIGEKIKIFLQGNQLVFNEKQFIAEAGMVIWFN